MNTARANSGGTGADSTSALVYGGYTTTALANTETWNGVSWAETTDISTARSAGGSSGTATAALYSGGNTGSKVGTTEEWNSPSNVVKTLTD